MSSTPLAPQEAAARPAEWPSEAWLEAATPQEILRWALQTYGDKLTMATAFGAEGCVLLDMLAKLRDEIGIAPDIFNLDTGFQFPQTLALRDRIQKKYGLTIRAIQPAPEVEEATAKAGQPLYKVDPNLCCYFRKVVPMQTAVQGFTAWITAIRRDQTPERAKAAIVGPDPQFDLVKINPLANWTKEQVWDYIRANEVPYNPLHEQGFPSIGCWPCTKPVAAGEDDRAGRWAGSEKRECGLHLRLSKKVEEKAEELAGI
jgi:phosphoadenosine phosphosulfate reductase